jgi:hypothetical protein
VVLLQTLIYGFSLLSPSSSHAQLGKPAVDAMVGINTRPQDYALQSRIRRFGHVRTFHPWSEQVGLAASTRARRTIDWPGTSLDPQTEIFLRYRYNFSQNGNSNYSTDDFYQGSSGRITPAMKDIAPEMRGLVKVPNYSETPFEQKPVNIKENEVFVWDGSDLNTPRWDQLESPDAPKIYRSYALQTTMFAARYGGYTFKQFSNYQKNFITPHLSSQVLGEQRFFANGLNSVDFMEIYNEPDKEWRDTPQSLADRKTMWRMWPEEYAAMHSAAADGHCRDLNFQIQPTILLNEQGDKAYLGIRNVDLGMRIIAGGLADLRGRYFEEVYEWCSANRGGNNCQVGAGANKVLPFDVLNIHHYSTFESAQKNVSDQYFNDASTTFGRGGVSPEDDKLRFRLRYFALRLRSRQPAYANLPIWFTEFGYDHAGASPIVVPLISGQSAQRTQAQWVMRTLLEVAASGVIDQADSYEIRDEPNGGQGLFNTCGLLNQRAEPKESWYYTQTLRSVLSGYQYAGNYAKPDKAFPKGQTVVDPPNALDEADWQNELKTLMSQHDPNNGDPASSINTPRMYRFQKAGSAQREIYAVWSPTSNGTSYTTDISVLRAATTAATLVKTVNMDENGVWEALSANRLSHNMITGRLTIKQVPVSETPIFIIFDESKTSVVPAAIDPSNVEVSDACCGDMTLRLPAPRCATCTYRVYFGLATDTDVVLDINDLDVRLYTETGAGASLLLSGLLEGVDYHVWVVPVSFEGDIPSTVINAIRVRRGAACTNCMVQVIGSSSIQYSSSSVGQQTAQQMASVLSNQAGACRNQEPDATWDAWNYNTNDAQETQVTVFFNTPKQITAAYYFDGAGEGKIEFEYMPCCRDVWIPWTSINTTKYNEWVEDGSFRGQVRAIRFRKLSEGARISSLMFCGADTECGTTVFGLTSETDTKVTIDFVSNTSADITWKPVFEWNDDAFEPMKGYEVVYSKSLTHDNKLSNPKIQRVLASKNELGTSAALRGLDLSTTYYGLVRSAGAWDAPLGEVPFAKAGPEPADPCVYAIFSEPFTFATTGEASTLALSRSPSTKLPVMYNEAEVSPNPSTGRSVIRMKEKGYQSAQIVEASTGRVVQSLKISAEVKVFEVDITDQVPGLYLVQVQSSKLRSFTVQILLVSEK